jgi:hypothetical protein
LRAPPGTEALDDQKKLSLETHYAWWTDVLMRGYVYQTKIGLEYFYDWHEFVTLNILYASYLEFAKRDRHPKSREDIGKILSTIGYLPSRPRNAVIGERRNSHQEPVQICKRSRGYQLGSLETARHLFDAHTKLSVEWVPPDQEEEDDPPEEIAEGVE